jgi:hypothetical protein
MNITLSIAILATLAFGLTLLRHILFKRELVRLREDMKRHTCVRE